jgi:hypothetical protein
MTNNLEHKEGWPFLWFAKSSSRDPIVLTILDTVVPKYLFSDKQDIHFIGCWHSSPFHSQWQLCSFPHLTPDARPHHECCGHDTDFLLWYRQLKIESGNDRVEDDFRPRNVTIRSPAEVNRRVRTQGEKSGTQCKHAGLRGRKEHSPTRLVYPLLFRAPSRPSIAVGYAPYDQESRIKRCRDTKLTSTPSRPVPIVPRNAGQSTKRPQ